MRTLLICVALAITLISATANAKSFKCNNRFVETGDSIATVLLRCGEPFYAEVISADDERRVERWTYISEGYRSFMRILTFNSGQLVDIKVGERAE